jgi:tripartite-type tricarboxylate transporter receptor subunit TctC
LLAAGIIAAIVSVMRPASAANYPVRPIRLVVPFAPGGNVDTTARLMVAGVAERLGGTIVIDNRAGAGGHVATETVAGAVADGYTLLIGASGLLSIAPAVSRDLKYDPTRDFIPITLVSSVAMVMFVPPASPANTVGQLIALAKARPGELNMAISGLYSTSQLTGALFQHQTGTRFVYVPYKGGGQAATDLMGGHVDVMFDPVPTAIGSIRSGKIRALAVTADTREVALPDVPTLQESGVNGVDAGNFSAVLAPAYTPPEIIRRLNEAMVAVLRTPAMRENFARFGARTIPGTPDAAVRYIREEIAKWKRVVNATGIKP